MILLRLKLRSMKIVISDEIKNKMKLGYCIMTDVLIQEENKELDTKFEQLKQEIKDKYQLETLSENEMIKSVRRMYSQTGLDPTKYRPSSEKLVRRILKDKDLYKINSAVDLCNYISIKYVLPLGLYDFDKINGDVEVRLGKEGEEYNRIGGDVVHASDKLVAVDQIGIFGNPTADSDRTKITDQTKQLLLLVFAPHNIEDVYLNELLEEFSSKMVEYNKAVRVDIGILV